MLVKKPVLSRKHYAIDTNKPAGYPNWIFIFFFNVRTKLFNWDEIIVQSIILYTIILLFSIKCELWQFQMCLSSITCHNRRTCRRWRALQLFYYPIVFKFSPLNNLKWFEAPFPIYFHGKIIFKRLYEHINQKICMWL